MSAVEEDHVAAVSIADDAHFIVGDGRVEVAAGEFLFADFEGVDHAFDVRPQPAADEDGGEQEAEDFEVVVGLVGAETVDDIVFGEGGYLGDYVAVLDGADGY